MNCMGTIGQSHDCHIHEHDKENRVLMRPLTQYPGPVHMVIHKRY